MRRMKMTYGIWRCLFIQLILGEMCRFSGRSQHRFSGKLKPKKRMRGTRMSYGICRSPFIQLGLDRLKSTSFSFRSVSGCEFRGKLAAILPLSQADLSTFDCAARIAIESPSVMVHSKEGTTGKEYVEVR
jgi:hypothetical protein